MKSWQSVVLCLLASLSQSFGQVSVEMVLGQEQYLSDETMPVSVRIANRSGQLLKLGEAGWITFTIENAEGLQVNKTADLPPGQPFTIESSSSATRRFDLMPFFDLSRPGRFRVFATLKIKEWDQEVASPSKRFDIGRGTTLWEQEFGVPTQEGAPEVRKYSLLQANYVNRPTVYLRLTDHSENIVYRVMALSPVVSFSRPEHQIDKQSHLHVLSQVGAHSFKYCEVNPQGELIARQTHYYLRSRPTLRVQDGKITVAGGVRQANADDIPVPPAVTAAAPAPASAAATNVTDAPRP